MSTPSEPVPVALGVEWWPEPMEHPADPRTVANYIVDQAVLERWRQARVEYLQARTALVGQLERQGWRAPERTPVYPERAAAMRIKHEPWCMAPELLENGSCFYCGSEEPAEPPP